MVAIPMFPLGMPLLPGSLMPLHIFEPRYVRLVRDLLADDAHPPEFGVVMIERGLEVGGGDARADVGTLGRVIDVQALEGDRYAIVLTGTERIRVVGWLPDDPYPLADIDVWPDEGAAPDDLASRVEELHRRLREINELVRELGRGDPPPDDEISDDPIVGLYHIAALSPLGAVDRHRVLAAPSVGERCDVVAEALDDARAVLEFHRS